MAFVRWRGNSADLLTTVYQEGRSRPVRLAELGGAYTLTYVLVRSCSPLGHPGRYGRIQWPT